MLKNLPGVNIPIINKYKENESMDIDMDDTSKKYIVQGDGAESEIIKQLEDKAFKKTALREFRPSQTINKLGSPIYFVSAHNDLTDEEFLLYYRDRLLGAIQNGGTFLITDGKGADEKIARFLRDNKGYTTIYHLYNRPNHNYGNFLTKGGYNNEIERDIAMSIDSTQDILWIKSCRDKSRVSENFIRRLKISNQTI